MPFNRNDIYTSSGSVMLLNAWTPYVSKFDTSSFYNWEQDNLPLYDLEERTYELWEQQGFATSAGVPGLSLTVSADTPAATLAANTTIFTDVSSCIAAIPKVVRFPVLVEIGNMGELGELELHNFRIEEGGSIEIINRAFARSYNASSECTATVESSLDNKMHRLIDGASSIDTSNALTDASCLHIASKVIRANGDTRVSSVNFAAYPRPTLRRGAMTVAIGQSTFWNNGNDDANIVKLEPYEESVSTSLDDTLSTLDVSATSQSTGNFIKRPGITGGTTGDNYTGNTYLNKLHKLSIKNCDGPIYIRNFFVDAQTLYDTAIEVVNSDVVLENCAAVRAKDAGFKFDNSKVMLSRSAAAYRNYEILTTTTRKDKKGYGFHAVNSDVTVSSDPTTVISMNSVGDTGASGSDCFVVASRNYAGFVLENSKFTGGVQRVVATQPLDGSIIGSELNTGFGLILNNSQMNTKGLLDIYGDDIGIEAHGSNLTFEQLCIDCHSSEAVRSFNSTITFDSPTSPTEAGQQDRKQLDMSANGQHIDLRKNSSFTFKRKNNIPTTYGQTRFQNSHGMITWAGANKFSLPSISVNDGSNLDLLHSTVLVNNTADSVASVPAYGRAIKAENNSKVSMFGTGSGCTFVFGPAGYNYQKKMAGLYARNGSEINLHGPTAVGQFGVDALAESNSTINIEPARLRDAYGLEVSGFNLESGENHTSVELHSTRACLVANKNSVINLTDLGAYPRNWARTSTGLLQLGNGEDYPIGSFDTSSYTQSGCLQFYPNPQDTTAIADFHLDDLTNADGLAFTVPDFPIFTLKTGLNRFFKTSEILDTANPNDLGKVTKGGVCLRATEDSVVNVKNVHFPVAPNTSPMDGLYYDTSGSECDQLLIWNIADTSRLNASFLSVSGEWPGSNAYHGPSALWVSSQTGDHGAGGASPAYVPASGAPHGTPDTGSLSILDAFGAGSSVLTIPSGADFNSPFDRFSPVSGTIGMNLETASALGQAGINVSGTRAYHWGAEVNTYKNQGIFRIYWTPRASARVLQSDYSGYSEGAYPHDGDFFGVIGPAYQLFAQGYNCSAPLSALPEAGEDNASGIYPDLLKLSYDTNGDGVPNELWTSGFYYCEEFVDDNPTQCMLDESAAKTFANAQNASIGLAGRPRKVTLYRSREDSSSNRGAEAYVGEVSGSIGFKSAAIFDLSRDN